MEGGGATYGSAFACRAPLFLVLPFPVSGLAARRGNHRSWRCVDSTDWGVLTVWASVGRSVPSCSTPVSSRCSACITEAGSAVRQRLAFVFLAESTGACGACSELAVILDTNPSHARCNHAHQCMDRVGS